MTLGVLHWLTEPWTLGLDRRALLEVVLLGLAGGALGVHLVFFSLAYSSESLAHALLPGLVLASLLGVPLLLGGLVGLIAGGLAIAVAARVPSIGRDTATGVVVTTLFGLGALLALSPDTPIGLNGLLFGDVLGVSDTDLALAGGLVVLLAVTLRLAGPRLAIVGFDRSSAPALGVRPASVDALLLVLLALTLLVAVQGLGNLLVTAVLIAPAAAARLVTRRLGPMMVASSAIAVLAGIGGIYLSYWGSVAAGASIALVLAGAYAVATLVSFGSSRRSRAA